MVHHQNWLQIGPLAQQQAPLHDFETLFVCNTQKKKVVQGRSRSLKGSEINQIAVQEPASRIKGCVPSTR